LVFDYYNRLSAKRQSVYRQSDAIAAITLPDPLTLQAPAGALDEALRSENRESSLFHQLVPGIAKPGQEERK
jgi:hypothetical protein